ncbi:MULTISPECIES: hypothetical protein [Streptomycetaceae]|uniref:hypothetical protein n=1 Tax=Streptomycetaceae TaxID=2062 RepID=UPI00093EC0BD|nr:hypothetical protein [Streptomyces sp. CB02056]OKI05630.1 hypothetical protein AMK13_20020 [Streptomyces sp. CB02056]
MNSWVNLDAVWKIVVVGLVTGAGLPALFALGLRLLNPSGPSGPSDPSGPADEAAAVRPTAGPVGSTLAGLIFALVLAAIGWGIYVIVNHR